jgi:protoheme IX farnesyltransferase
LLTKPRVVALIVFTAVIGMFLATPGMVPLRTLLAATAGIWLVAGAAAAVNCLVEQKIDAVMSRTSWRPLPQGELTAAQNIVIGGASGAMPPVLGWAAVTGEVTIEPLVLFLIIFAWTPPHFWSLALYRTEDYLRAGVPMLPVTHGKQYTRLQVLLYTLILFAVSLLPYVIRMSGLVYLVAALALGAMFVSYALRIYLAYSDAVAQKTFRYSIAYLAFLFAALLVDHYL